MHFDVREEKPINCAGVRQFSATISSVETLQLANT